MQLTDLIDALQSIAIIALAIAVTSLIRNS